MDITKFVELSLGCWRSQRSVHHLAFGHFEEVTSTIKIEPLTADDSAAIEVCKLHQIDPDRVVCPFRMSWEGTSDWDEEEDVRGTTVLVPIPNPDNPKVGQLLRDRGYAETIPSIGEYRITEEGTFILVTPYDRAMAEEKIWFVNPNFRLRTSLIKTNQGSGVVTASFSSEIRTLSSSTDDSTASE
ncbi:MAG: phycobiliprotein lyase [Cyanobacteria bacterium SID2]|nr:phycobiliprotein lyase [Cyanobacteria bacterium SID2]